MRAVHNDMSSERHRRLAFSVIASVAGQVVSLVTPILLMPAMLTYLGDVAFGIWASSVAVTSVTAFLDLGIGSGLLSRLAQAHGSRDDHATRRYIASAYAVLGAISCSGLLILALATALGIATQFSTSTTWSIVLAVLASFFVGMPAVVVYRILYAQQRIPLQSMLQSLGSISSLMVCFAAIRYEASPWLVVAAYSGTPVIVMLATSLWFFGSYKSLRLRLGDFSINQTRQLVGFGSHFFFLSILTAIGSNADILIISMVAGPEAVANFVPPMRIGSVLGLLVMQLFMPLWSFNGEALARGDVAWVRRTTVMMSGGGATLVLFFGLVVTALSDHIMLLWMHRIFEHQALVLAAMTASSAVIAFTSPYNMVLNAKGLANVQIKPWLAFVLVSVGLKFCILSKYTTWLAPAISFLCYLLIITPAMVYLARRALR